MNQLPNTDPGTVEGFGAEWSYFPQSSLDQEERRRIFSGYFSAFPWHLLPDDGGCGADVGCGSGRWAPLVASRVRKLHLIDASAQALEVAREALKEVPNLEFHHASVDSMPFENGTLDFAYSLGVLHHVPDTGAALRSIAAKLRPGAPLLVYLYYAFDNRPVWYRALWRVSDALRKVISRMPFIARVAISGAFALTAYLPLARTGALLDRAGRMPRNWPLAQYRDSSFYTMRTDALDRFGTRLEHRYTRAQIQTLLEDAGFVDLRFSPSPPHWCVVGLRSNRAVV